MKVPTGNASNLAKRLSEILVGDLDNPEVIIADDTEVGVDEDGKAYAISAGAEAILIIRGPEASRRLAVQKLLAILETQP